MAATGTALARKRGGLPRWRALELVSSLTMLVACSPAEFAVGSVVIMQYEVYEESRAYAFPRRPFRIMREITRQEYTDALPPEMRNRTYRASFFYEIHTD